VQTDKGMYKKSLRTCVSGYVVYYICTLVLIWRRNAVCRKNNWRSVVL